MLMVDQRIGNVYAVCAQLAQQNQALFEKLADTERDYAMVSEFYDQAVAQSGAAQEKMERKRNAA